MTLPIPSQMVAETQARAAARRKAWAAQQAATVPEPPAHLTQFRPRALLLEKDLTPPDRPTVTLDAALRQMQQTVLDYLALDKPDHMLLIQLEPGTGKTTSLVEIVELMACQQKRTFWAMPRHEMFNDLMDVVSKTGGDPRSWYHWTPRKGVPGMAIDPLCRWHGEIEQWMQRGYEANTFCANPKICGLNYMHHDCAYWAQGAIKHPIVCGTHQHLISGNMVLDSCSIIVGDEYPLGMFAGMLEVPADALLPKMLPYDQPFTEIVHTLHSLTLSGGHFSGRKLLDLLGGPEQVLEACGLFGQLDVGDMYEQPNLRDALAVEKVPYQHIERLYRYLEREASAALHLDSYIERLAVHDGRLVYRISNRLVDATEGRHMIWLDATGNPDAYRHAFGKDVQVVSYNVQKQGKIIVDWSSLNSRKKMIKDGKPTPHTLKIKERIRYIIQKYGYTRPVIITHKPLVDAGVFAELGECAYFGNARGTNKFEGCDVVFVVGCPQPPKDTILDLAAAIESERMNPYDDAWSDQQSAYDFLDDDGNGRSYAKADFWNEPILRALMWQSREAELIQAIHRGRPIRYPCDVWLFTNLPITEIQVDQIVQFRDVVGAPVGIDGDTWCEVLTLAYQLIRERGFITTQDLIDRGICKREQARKCIDGLAEYDPELFPPLEIKAVGRGRPRKGVGTYEM